MTVDLDMVEHPQHYLKHPSGLEVIDITRHHNFCVGNALKYIFRHEYKGKPVEDLRKAIQYIEFEIADIEKRQAEVELEVEEVAEEQAEPAFKVGDMVRHKTVASGDRGIVEEVEDGRARVRWLSWLGVYYDPFSDLEHLPPTEWFREGDRVRKRNDRGLIGPNAATFQFYKPISPSGERRAWCIWDWDVTPEPLHSDPESLELIPEELPA